MRGQPETCIAVLNNSRGDQKVILRIYARIALPEAGTWAILVFKPRTQIYTRNKFEKSIGIVLWKT